MDKKKITVLRYGHRLVRDARVTSHCCLVARAFGAEEVVVEGTADEGLEKSVQEIVENWGGKFKLAFTDNWKKTVEDYRKQGYKIVHLTMYGIPASKKLESLKQENKLLVLIGSQKVEREVYEVADYNISITLQPHSEIGALGVFLYMLNGDKVMEKEFTNAGMKVKPSEQGKNIISGSGG